MTRQHSTQPDPKLDLVLERTIDVPPALVWQAWTQPEHIKHWLTPAPWQTVRCDVDLRPRGRFRFVMRSPEGEEHTHDCCYLEIVEGSRLVWTNALLPGFRPAGGGGDVPAFTAGHPHRTPRPGHALHGHRHAWHAGRLPPAQRHGFPRRLGRGAGPAGGARPEYAAGKLNTGRLRKKPSAGGLFRGPPDIIQRPVPTSFVP